MVHYGVQWCSIGVVHNGAAVDSGAKWCIGGHWCTMVHWWGGVRHRRLFIALAKVEGQAQVPISLSLFITVIIKSPFHKLRFGENYLQS